MTQQELQGMVKCAAGFGGNSDYDTFSMRNNDTQKAGAENIQHQFSSAGENIKPFDQYRVVNNSATYYLKKLISYQVMGFENDPSSETFVNHALSVHNATQTSHIRQKIYEDTVRRDLAHLDTILAQMQPPFDGSIRPVAVFGGTALSVLLTFVTEKLVSAAWFASCICGAAWIWHLIYNRRLGEYFVIHGCRRELERIVRRTEERTLVYGDENRLSDGWFKMFERLRSMY